MVNLSYTLGSLLLGGLFSATLTGMMSVQSLLYFKLFPKDKRRIKALVTVLCGTVWAGLWNYLIIHFDDTARINQIPQAISVGLSPTTLSTNNSLCRQRLPSSLQPFPPFVSICSSLSESFGVSIFLIRSLLTLSQLLQSSIVYEDELLTSLYLLDYPRIPPSSLCLWLSIETYSRFRNKFGWVFSTGLGLSSAVDILITGSLLKLLHANRKSSLSFDHVIDSLILYTLECGAVTCAATIASMICWLTMSNNLVFLGLHFVISKLYSNSLLATLITRYELRNSRERSTSDGIVDLDVFNMRNPRRVNILTPGTSFTQPVQVSVKQSVIQYGPDGSTEAEL
ncbi:hypothetical protein DFS33DRAFT_1272342 [Desarmillaria ectypa]|nr:hypothetical protein DFS33DRAFT_1272342 [Desarmillaria ectypa]